MISLRFPGLSRASSFSAFVMMLSLAIVAMTRSAPGAGASGPLLRLVPNDAGATLAVEDLKGTAREVLDSPLFEAVRRLAVVKEWLDSGHLRGFVDAAEKVEQVLGEKVSMIRDDLLGEAFVLTLHVPANSRPDEARGLLLIRVPNQDLLDRIIVRVNTEKIARGEFRRISDRSHRGVSYHVREMPAAGHDEEFYASLKDRVFIWSNSESLILSAIDRQAGAARGLSEESAFRAVHEGLPDRAIASLYVDPQFVRKMLDASARIPKPEDERLFALATRYLKAVRYAGASVVWREGLVLQTREVFDPEKLTPGMKRWASRRETPDPMLRRIPSTALIVASTSIDPVAVLDTLTELVAPKDRAKLATLWEALKGVMLAQDVRDDVAANIGPGLVAYIERPVEMENGSRFPLVVAFEIARGPAGIKAGAAVANGLRTILAVHALDPKNGDEDATIESRPSSGTDIVGLSKKTPYAFAFADNRLVLGNTVAAVSRALQSQANQKSGGSFAKFREDLFPDARSYLVADLKAIRAFADRSRPDLARKLAARQQITLSEGARELDRALALFSLFDVAYLANTIEPGFLAVNRTIGLVRSATAPAP